MPTTRSPQSPAQARRSAADTDLTPLYAMAGLTEAVATNLRSAWTLTTDRATARLRSVPGQIKTLPEQTRTGLGHVSATYENLAGRGKRLLDEAKDDVTEAIDPALERVQEGVTSARRRLTGHTATATMTPRSAAKGAATRTGAARRTPAAAPPAKTPARKVAQPKR
ncbi:MAG: hypothetical protein ACLGIF_01545 [Actinomycetes bacterium]